jgi:hypothetical protein
LHALSDRRNSVIAVAVAIALLVVAWYALR